MRQNRRDQTTKGGTAPSHLARGQYSNYLYMYISGNRRRELLNLHGSLKSFLRLLAVGMARMMRNTVNVGPLLALNLLASRRIIAGDKKARAQKPINGKCSQTCHSQLILCREDLERGKGHKRSQLSGRASRLRSHGGRIAPKAVTVMRQSIVRVSSIRSRLDEPPAAEDRMKYIFADLAESPWNLSFIHLLSGHHPARATLLPPNEKWLIALSLAWGSGSLSY